MAIRHYCTLFDRNYLFKGVAMLRSLVRHSKEANIYVLCIDEVTGALLRKLEIPGVHTISLAEVETSEVLAAKKNRSIAEYCWTLSSVTLWHVIQSVPSVDLLTYLDADLMFFSDVEPVFEEMGSASILAIEHRYPPERKRFEIYGKFNVQWVSFRRDRDGLDCLKTWRAQCLDWCYARIEDGKHGDQMYLDAWPELYGTAFHSLQNVGAGLAPWNYSNYKISQEDNCILVDGTKLIFYHFHQFQILEGGGFKHFSTRYFEGAKPPERVYELYWQSIRSAMDAVRLIEPEFSAGIRAASTIRFRSMASRLLPTKLKGALKRVGLRTW